MRTDIFDAGLALMLYGMGTVVMFLVLLVLATTLMSWLLQRYFPQPVQGGGSPVNAGRRPAPPAPQASSGPDQQLVAVMTAAIHRYRTRR